MLYALLTLALASDAPDGMKVSETKVKVNTEYWRIAQDEEGKVIAKRKKKKGETEPLEVKISCDCTDDDAVCNIQVNDDNAQCVGDSCCKISVDTGFGGTAPAEKE